MEYLVEAFACKLDIIRKNSKYVKGEACQGEHWNSREKLNETQGSFATPQQTQREKASGATCWA